jgi:hypothetical protein
LEDWTENNNNEEEKRGLRKKWWEKGKNKTKYERRDAKREEKKTRKCHG